MPIHRTLVEDPIYAEQLEKLGDVRRLDDLLHGVLNSIATNAEMWPVVAGYQITRLAKTDGYGNTPVLRVWFQIESANQILLVGVELDLTDQDDGA